MRRIFGGRDSNHPRKRGRFSTCAALLVAGLALGAGCHSREPKPVIPKAEHKSPVRQAVANTHCVMKKLGGLLNQRTVRQGKCTVKEGDELLGIEFLFEKAGYFTWKVGKIDKEGVEVPFYDNRDFRNYDRFVQSINKACRKDPRGCFKKAMEKATPDKVSAKARPSTKVRYGETKTLRLGAYVLPQTLTVRAERGSIPGTAVLHIRYYEPKRE